MDRGARRQPPATGGVQQVLRRGCGCPPLIFQLISQDSGEQRPYFPLELFTSDRHLLASGGGEVREGKV